MIQVKYVNIDDWNRPVFKDIKRREYYGSTEKLFPYEEPEKSVLQTVSASDLCYFGNRFNCEPMGTPVDNIEIVTEIGIPKF